MTSATTSHTRIEEQSMAFSGGPCQEVLSGKDLLVQFTLSLSSVQFVKSRFLEWHIDIQSRVRM
jgi:hypothetical protein